MRTQLSLALGFILLATPVVARPPATAFKIVKLVSNVSGKAANTDPNLINPWGLAQSGTNPIWAADNGTGLSTVYAQGTGTVGSTVVTIPMGSPTGIVYAGGSNAWQISENGKSGNSSFIFDSIAGVLSGWSSSVDAKNAVIAVDNSASGAQYTGLAVDTTNKLLFAANFAQNQVEVYDGNWNLTKTFTDSSLTGFAPYNVAIINGNVYVTFAKFGVTGGYVDVFSESGTLQQQLIANGNLNEPWGLTIAPSTFGTYANTLLVGNFGDGKINSYDPSTGTFIGTLANKRGRPIKSPGLWALDPVPTGDVTFSAGPKQQTNGLIGLIKPL